MGNSQSLCQLLSSWHLRWKEQEMHHVDTSASKLPCSIFGHLCWGVSPHGERWQIERVTHRSFPNSIRDMWWIDKEGNIPYFVGLWVPDTQAKWVSKARTKILSFLWAGNKRTIEISINSLLLELTGLCEREIINLTCWNRWEQGYFKRTIFNSANKLFFTCSIWISYLLVLCCLFLNFAEFL